MRMSRTYSFCQTFFILGLLILTSAFMPGLIHAQDFPTNVLTIENYTDAHPVLKVPSEIEEMIVKQRKIASMTELPIVRVPILMYHYVEYVTDEKDTTRQLLNTYPHVLDAQIKTLKEAGYTFLTHKELSDILMNKSPLPKKPVVLTFDDGYRDFYTDAYPILKKYQVKATQYVISGLLYDKNYMTPVQVSEIAQDGLVEIGAHTVDHPWMKNQSVEYVKFEAEESKKQLEKLTGHPVTSFAYPYGAFDLQTIEAVKKAGFTSAVSTIPGNMHSHDTKYFLYRIRPGISTGEEFINYLQQSKY